MIIRPLQYIHKVSDTYISILEVDMPTGKPWLIYDRYVVLNGGLLEVSMLTRKA